MFDLLQLKANIKMQLNASIEMSRNASKKILLRATHSKNNKRLKSDDWLAYPTLLALLSSLQANSSLIPLKVAN